jgi:BirA family transcriptional regulator, biotin operon repressor / biotin---[acetyl-CoA-carboxylase] ligase
MTSDAGARLRRFLDELAGPGGDGALPGPANRIVAARVDSTNRLARGVVATYLADEVRPPALLILALEQTAGRGRRGRAWASPPCAGVYVTRVLPLPEDGEGGEAVHRAIQSLPLLVAVGLARALDGLLPAGREGEPAERPRLKWPNDVLIGGRKIAGILAESLALGSGPPVALLGYGVNHARSRPDLRAGAPSDGPGLPEGATTLGDHLASPPSLGATARALVAGVEAELVHLGDLGYAVPAYRELSAHRPGDRLRCRSGEETVEGEFEGFDDRGHLRLRRDGGMVLLAAGEIVEDRTHDG